MSTETKPCQECGRDIHPARLKALPNATLCIVCQETNDVPRTKKFETYDCGGELNTEIFYESNPYIENYVKSICPKLGHLRDYSPDDTPYT